MTEGTIVYNPRNLRPPLVASIRTVSTAAHTQSRKHSGRTLIARRCHDREAKITVVGVPDIPGKAARIFNIVAETGANIDMIVQNVSVAATGLTDISFTLPKSEGQLVLAALTAEQDAVGFSGLQYDDHIGKLALVGAGRTNAGVSANSLRHSRGRHQY
jgi:aspartate kinase